MTAHMTVSGNCSGMSIPIFPTQYDVGVDNNDFTPVSYARVKEIISRQTGVCTKEPTKSDSRLSK